MKNIVLSYNPQPRQDVLHKSVARQILYGGAAGGGKSHALRWDAIEFCLSNPGLDAYLFRRTLPQLEANHIRKIRTELPKELGDYNATKKRFEFSNGSGINFCHCETEADVHNYQGAEIHWLGIDEAGQFTSYQINYLRGHNRLGEFSIRANQRYVSGKYPLLPRCVLSANPGGTSHDYLKMVYIDPAPPEKYFYDETMKNPNNPEHKGWLTVFIPAKMADNKYLDQDYAGQFGGLPDWLQKMLRDGDWNIAAGAFFDCWDTRKNVIPAFDIPEYWTKFPSVDWGHATPFSIGWWAVVGDDDFSVHGRLLPRGALIRYREWYGKLQGKVQNVGLKMDGTEVGSKAKSLSPEKLSVGVCDPSAWRSDMGPSQAEEMIKAGFLIHKADNERKAGWQEMYQRIRGNYDLDTKQYIPMLYATDDCREFIKCIPMLPSDDKDPEEIDDKFKEDHIGDETRYACMSRPLTKEKPKKKRGTLDPLTFKDVAGDITTLQTERFRERI